MNLKGGEKQGSETFTSAPRWRLFVLLYEPDPLVFHGSLETTFDKNTALQPSQLIKTIPLIFLTRLSVHSFVDCYEKMFKEFVLNLFFGLSDNWMWLLHLHKKCLTLVKITN